MVASRAASFQLRVKVPAPAKMNAFVQSRNYHISCNSHCKGDGQLAPPREAPKARTMAGRLTASASDERIKSGRTLSEAYRDANLPVVRTQLYRAWPRLMEPPSTNVSACQTCQSEV